MASPAGYKATWSHGSIDRLILSLSFSPSILRSTTALSLFLSLKTNAWPTINTPFSHMWADVRETEVHHLLSACVCACMERMHAYWRAPRRLHTHLCVTFSPWWECLLVHRSCVEIAQDVSSLNKRQTSTTQRWHNSHEDELRTQVLSFYLLGDKIPCVIVTFLL